MMASTETLRVRVDKATSRRVHAWAKQHETDVSGVLRLALERLLDEADRLRRLEEARRRLEESFKLRLFDPPRPDETWKAGGFK